MSLVSKKKTYRSYYYVTTICHISFYFYAITSTFAFLFLFSFFLFFPIANTAPAILHPNPETDNATIILLIVQSLISGVMIISSQMTPTANPAIIPLNTSILLTLFVFSILMSSTFIYILRIIRFVLSDDWIIQYVKSIYSISVVNGQKYDVNGNTAQLAIFNPRVNFLIISTSFSWASFLHLPESHLFFS